jgi:hypothetical protein
MQVRTLQRILPLTSVVLVATALLAGAATQADAEEKRFGQEVIEILRDEGKIDDERYEELRKLEEAEHEAAEQSASSEPDPKGFPFVDAYRSLFGELPSETLSRLGT